MRPHRLFALALCLSPLPAMAQENAALCEDLYRRLANAPHIIGNTSDVREHAQALTKQNIEIRKLRLDMRRHECGSISITPLGGPNDHACRALRQMLSDMEQNRKDILSARNQARSLVITNHETKLIRADIKANNCTPPDFEATTVSIELLTKLRGSFQCPDHMTRKTAGVFLKIECHQGWILPINHRQQPAR
ncbi:hypothetical protein GAO09_14870 [Rhizobiales bacterium RZME27]|uniref:Uncharacterized protein n=1 Tax=Endobacterium cereale TaxID=2663029 RepID=A0A6A8A9B3_9HYPH|nr:hypothetical protein [Endobacterium cereale]MQY47319.1 hypothetical protein [Endobacterium cereale]